MEGRWGPMSYCTCKICLFFKSFFRNVYFFRKHTCTVEGRWAKICDELATTLCFRFQKIFFHEKPHLKLKNIPELWRADELFFVMNKKSNEEPCVFWKERKNVIFFCRICKIKNFEAKTALKNGGPMADLHKSRSRGIGVLFLKLIFGWCGFLVMNKKIYPTFRHSTFVTVVGRKAYIFDSFWFTTVQKTSFLSKTRQNSPKWSKLSRKLLKSCKNCQLWIFSDTTHHP